MLNETLDDTQTFEASSCDCAQTSATQIARSLAAAVGCPRFSKCSAAYCPALGPVLGGKHYKDERACSYLLESVKDGGTKRIRESLRTDLADTVVKDALHLLNSTGPLQSALQRASKQGSKIESIRRAAGSRKISS